jgi:hypothetical protein
MLARLVILGVILSTQVAAAESCNAMSKVDATCSCDVGTLRPLQGALGRREVEDKKDDINEDLEKEREDLKKDPIKVIRGPGGALFVTDHHHGAEAWRLAGHPDAFCRIEKGPKFVTEDQFWSALKQKNLVHLEDADGKPLMPAQLPSSLADMPDDPYRSLARYVRKANGFCRSIMKQKEFAEFIWADFLRTRPEVPADKVRAAAKDEELVQTAVKLARSPAAKDLPGYVGDKPDGFKCPKDKD